ncbi:MAG: carbon-nitrogen hydrolase family protein [Deltaproteobacteria bacterium]|nr:carbon-nitrogen hydrolase family protein [Deltaproteobacteria bacterium]
MTTLITAAVQMTSTSDKKDNFKKVASFVAEAVAKKARLIVLPEHWNWLGKSKDKKNEAEPITGPSIQFIQQLAKQHQCLIVAGSIAETNGDKPPFNTSVFIHADGTLGKVYRKMHLFDANVAGGHKESETTSCGKEIAIEKTEWGEIGMAVCYDVRFPELFTCMRKAGASLFVIPANFTAVTGAPHWEVLLRARAIENQCFVIAADQTGITGAGWEAHGHSMIVDPWGEILAMAGKEEGIITAKIDLEKISEVRNKMPVHAHRKLM